LPTNNAASQRVKSVRSLNYVSKTEAGIWPGVQENNLKKTIRRSPRMKKLMACLLALTFAMSLTAFAQQDNNMSQTQSDQASAKAPLMTLKRTVKADGDKYTFVNDKDGKSWDVMNPEELKGHEGHHVQLSAHVYADKGYIHIMSVKMLKGGSMSNDSMSK
jgi:hypothetical protein